ncbi:tRNA (adenosine(37)-N6)-threonylcarbamoyltransferase complex transferase subunit TsaD [Candidatus Shikimatogenerans silvanidophilus]|uniref:tRNA (adenosine(37)-N6)-threonylcarbamoyltransferase complex transferase subunit TsaD n=1 Tax=Candidatus Shikimatogenerans silvanidophilus TaxID=2782547 RepID=UPI001BAB0F3B|nr:tRNA (adenosine(37)-N6)-threonylcarbamoyltransferase complex transferase subunit TsaD [Candidatus Shikimatogenerans silvanidophilus]
MVIILGIESSCDDTSASIIKKNKVLSNVIFSQKKIHKQYNGVVPDLASKFHHKKIIRVVDIAIKKSKINTKYINAIAFSYCPGMIGSLLIASSFSKSFSMSYNIPLIGVNHIKAHILAHFIKNKNDYYPSFPFLCLTSSGGHTNIVIVKDFLNMETIGKTIDDSAGELIDKSAIILGLGYPGGQIIEKCAKKGKLKFYFNIPKVKDLNFSFSGLKTNFKYFIQKNKKINKNFIQDELHNLCFSLQETIIKIFIEKIKKSVKKTNIKNIAFSGGLSRNIFFKKKLFIESKKNNWKLFFLENQYTTDNAAMIAIHGYYKYIYGKISSLDIIPCTNSYF